MQERNGAGLDHLGHRHHGRFVYIEILLSGALWNKEQSPCALEEDIGEDGLGLQA